jgi:hypothetical protein
MISFLRKWELNPFGRGFLKVKSTEYKNKETREKENDFQYISLVLYAFKKVICSRLDNLDSQNTIYFIPFFEFLLSINKFSSSETCYASNFQISLQK